MYSTMDDISLSGSLFMRSISNPRGRVSEKVFYAFP